MTKELLFSPAEARTPVQLLLFEQNPMTENAALFGVPAFVGLPEDQIAWFLAQAQCLRCVAGEVLINANDPADAMFVILEGQLQARGELGGERPL